MKKEVISIRKNIPPYKNELPYFKEWSKGLATVGENNELTITSVAAGQNTEIYIPILPNQVYTISIENGDRIVVDSVDGANAQLIRHVDNTTKGKLTVTFTTSTVAVKLRIILATTAAGTIVFKNPILVKGNYSSLVYYPKNWNEPIKERLKDNGSVEEIRVRFYAGVERTLKVSPYLLHKAGRREDLFTYPNGTEGYISGDNDSFAFPVSIDFEYDDEIVVDFENVGTYIYTLAVDIIVNYYREEVYLK